MDDKHREILRRYSANFKQDLEPDKLYDILHELLDARDIEELRSMPTRVAAVDKLLEIIPRRGPEAFHIFMKAVQETQPFLATLLQNAELEVKLKIKRKSGASLKSEVLKVKKALEREIEEHKKTQKKLEELKSQHDEMMVRDENHEKVSELVKDVNFKLEYLQKKSDEGEKQREEQNSKLYAKERQAVQLRYRLEIVSIERTELRRENDKLTERLKKAEEKSRGEAKAKRDAFDELELLRKGSGQKQELNLQNVKKDIDNSRNDLDEEKKKLNETEKKLKAETEAKEDAMNELEKLREESRHLTYNVENLGKESDKLKKDIEKQKSKNEQELAKLKDQVKKKELENERVLKDFEKLQKDNDQLRRDFESKKLKGVFHYEKDFDKNGVIYAMGTSFGGTKWENPSSKSDLSIKVTATRSSDKLGSASDLFNNSDKTGKESCTKDENGSWWCVALSEKYFLYLTHYTLRHGLRDGNSFLRNWKLEGSLDGSNWKELRKHDNDGKLNRPFEKFTATWSIDRDVGAFRHFKIVQTGENSTSNFGINLSGIELYGALFER